MDVNLIRFTQKEFPLSILNPETNVKAILRNFTLFAPAFLERLGSSGYLPIHFSTKNLEVTGKDKNNNPIKRYFHILRMPVSYEKAEFESIGTAPFIYIVFEDNKVRYFSVEHTEIVNEKNESGCGFVLYEYKLINNSLYKKIWDSDIKIIDKPMYGCFTGELITETLEDSVLYTVEWIIFLGRINKFTVYDND